MNPTFLPIFLTKFPAGVCTLTGTNPGPTVTIVAFTHGNEIAGIHVFDFLLNIYHLEQNLRKGKVHLIVANIKAAKNNQRLIDKDMNRVWDFRSEESHTYEYQRAKELTSFFSQSNAVLDIHSTSNPSQPMILPVSQKTFPIELREQLHSDYVLYDILNLLHGKPLVTFAQEQTGRAECIAIESGQHTSPETLDNAIQNTLQFLAFYGLITEPHKQSIQKKNLQVFRALHAQSLNVQFLYSNQPKSFDFLRNKTPIVHNGTEVIHADQDSYLVMPSQPKYVGEEIGYLAKELS